MDASITGETLTYKDLEALIEADLFDPLPTGLVDPAWLELPELEIEWLELPEVELEWLKLPEIEPEWLQTIEQVHIEESEQSYCREEQIFDAREL